MPDFEALGLHPSLLRGVQAAGHTRATPVQAAVIPGILAGRDVRAQAATGSGKTLAFGLPMLQRLIEEPRVRGTHGNQVAGLVLAPTRELVIQIADVLVGFACHAPRAIRIVAAHGGVAINPQLMALRGGADILVATPGRLLDLHRHNAVKFAQLRSLVLDEADRLLAPDYREELDQVLALLPARRQNLLFSATFPEHTNALTRSLLREPLEVAMAQVSAAPTQTEREPDIEQHVYVVDPARKAELLVQLLRERDLPRALVFVSMKKTASTLIERLSRAAIPAAVFHADKSQSERQRNLARFRSGQLRVLLATDLAARGLDIDDLPVVINVELPRSPSDYLHRVGRTGRAGRSGLALTLITAADEPHFRVIEKRIKRRLPRERIAGFEP